MAGLAVGSLSHLCLCSIHAMDGLAASGLAPFELPMLDKTSLNILRLLDMLALTYLVPSSEKMRILARHRLLRSIEACGRHSLEVFAAGCVFALFGRLIFRTYGPGPLMQVTLTPLG